MVHKDFPHNYPVALGTRVSFRSAIVGVLVGLVAGILTGFQPLLSMAAIACILMGIGFFTRFEQTVLGLLILRSSLDILSTWQIPGAFALALDVLTLIYIIISILTHQQIHTDWFWWFFALWVIFQGLWLVLLPLGGLGLDGSFLPDSIREWIRLFSWLMIYLLVMQLKGKIAPKKMIKLLFLALILPLTVATMQLLIPEMLPDFLAPTAGHTTNAALEVSRIRGTMGHSNTFTTILLLFIGLCVWQWEQNKKQYWWLFLLIALAVFFVSTKALFGLMMLATFVLILLIPKLNAVNLVAGILFILFIVAIFASTPFGQERLASLMDTPLINPDIDVWKAILLSKGDENSFNWRIAQWAYLLQQWQHYPWFGYGLGVSQYVSNNLLYPHNDYIRALVEQGIVGLLSFLGLFIVQEVRLFQLVKSRAKQQRSLCLVMLGLLSAIPIGMITENIWSHTTLFFYWWTLLAVLGWDWQPNS